MALSENTGKGSEMDADKIRIRELEKQLAEKESTILALQKSINELTRQVSNLTEAILQMRHDKYVR